MVKGLNHPFSSFREPTADVIHALASANANQAFSYLKVDLLQNGLVDETVKRTAVKLKRNKTFKVQSKKRSLWAIRAS
jgi:hypothetical protein